MIFIPGLQLLQRVRDTLDEVQIQIDCIMPYIGTAGQLMAKVCANLSKPDPQIEVWPNVILNRSTESTASGKLSVIL